MAYADHLVLIVRLGCKIKNNLQVRKHDGTIMEFEEVERLFSRSAIRKQMQRGN